MAKWQPDDDQLQRIEQLALLGNPIERIAADIGIPKAGIPDFKKDPKVKAALKAAEKAAKNAGADWWPKPEHLGVIEDLFSKSQSYKEVARQLNTTEKTFRKRAAEIPQLAAAIERGEARRNEKLVEIAHDLSTTPGLMARNPGLLIFMLKQHLGWSDKKEVNHTGNVTVTAQLAPMQRVGPEKMPVMIEKEMKKIGRTTPASKPVLTVVDEDEGEPESETTDVTVDAQVIPVPERRADPLVMLKPRTGPAAAPPMLMKPEPSDG